MKICKIEGCKNNVMAKEYCRRHYNQMWKYGKVLERTKFDKNEIIDCGDYCEICLYNSKKREVARTKIDKDDLEKIKKHKWCLNINGYVATRNSKKHFYLHQLILGKKDGFEIDHKNNNPLDNREQNLRHATRSQNKMNQKNVKGYTWDKENNKWIAQIHFNKKYYNLGRFKNKQDAILARLQAEQKYFGEFACNKI